MPSTDLEVVRKTTAQNRIKANQLFNKEETQLSSGLTEVLVTNTFY